MKSLAVLNLINLVPRKFGGFEEFFLVLSKALAERGHKSILGFTDLPPPSIAEKYREVGAVVHRVDLATPRLKWATLRQLICEHDLDILHGTFLDVFSSDTLRLKRWGMKRVVFSDQVSYIPTPRSWLREQIARTKNRAISRWIDLVIADAQYVRKNLIRRSAIDARKVEVVYNGVNIHRFDPARRASITKQSLGISPDHLVVTTVANCIKWKGLDVFLRAAAEVLGRGVRAEFVIVGDGLLFDELQQLAASLGIAHATHFLGLRDDVHEILALSDVFVLCSLWEEAFALVLLEAMASGLPVVASNIGAIPESIVDGTTGILFPPGDSQAAAAAIAALLEDETLRRRMGKAGRERVVQNFRIEQWVQNTIDLYEKLMSC